MNITLDQLKEIAKAGSQDNEKKTAFDIKYLTAEINRGKLSGSKNKNLLYFGALSLEVIINDNYVSFNAWGGFNHLAAIRKMEELGIIEK